MLKGLIFDLDGVIADTARFHLQAWNQLAQRLILYYHLKQTTRCVGVHGWIR